MLETPRPVFCETLAPAVKLCVFTEPLGELWAVTLHMELGWVCRVAGTQSLVVGRTSPVPWLSRITDGASVPGGSGGNHGLVDRLCSPRMGLCGRGYSVPNQGSSDLEPSDLILPCGPALLKVLEPGHMISSDHRPPKGLLVLHHLLEMNSHFVPGCILLEGYDGEISFNEGHGGHAFIDHRLTLGCKH